MINASGWSGDIVPYTYTISNAKITSNSIVDLILNPNTEDMINVIAGALISGYSQTTGQFTIKAWGERPSMDISATLVIRGGI